MKKERQHIKGREKQKKEGVEKRIGNIEGNVLKACLKDVGKPKGNNQRKAMNLWKKPKTEENRKTCF